MKITEFNFLGEYRSSNPDGTFIVYSVGDVVYYNNEAFVASKIITGINPYNRLSGWLSLSKIQVFYENENAPVFAKPGDEWRNTSTSILYKKINDTNGDHWVQI
tara:strand:- start:3010 stop:3321 length:312 start_codon:yes stop_codon:yes gene_type:complete